MITIHRSLVLENSDAGSGWLCGTSCEVYRAAQVVELDINAEEAMKALAPKELRWRREFEADAMLWPPPSKTRIRCH